MKGLGCGKLNLVEIGMTRIQQNIPIPIDNDGGYAERDGTTAGRPAGTEIAADQVVQLSPVRGQTLKIQRLDQLVGDHRSRQQKIVRRLVLLQIDEELQGSSAGEWRR